MSAKTSARRLDVFLHAFAATGNQGLAAEQAGVSRSTIYNLRKSDPAFDGRWRAAKGESARRLAAGGCNRPPGAWKQRRGVDLVVQRTSRRPPQVVRSLRTVWTPRAEGRFLGKLRQCNNVRLACAWAEMTVSSYEAHWRRWPDFRLRVSEARAFAGLYLDAATEAERARGFDPGDPDELESPPLSIAELIRMVRRNRRR